MDYYALFTELRTLWAQASMLEFDLNSTDPRDQPFLAMWKEHAPTDPVEYEAFFQRFSAFCG